MAAVQGPTPPVTVAAGTRTLKPVVVLKDVHVFWRILRLIPTSHEHIRAALVADCAYVAPECLYPAYVDIVARELGPMSDPKPYWVQHIRAITMNVDQALDPAVDDGVHSQDTQAAIDKALLCTPTYRVLQHILSVARTTPHGKDMPYKRYPWLETVCARDATTTPNEFEKK